jgi:hypothetical protein
MFGSIYRLNFIKKRLSVISGQNDERLLKKFVNSYLGSDTIFVLRLLEYNASATLVYDLINQMWSQFNREIKQ